MTIHNEQGRTMLEMLGVLAIMGIITYGAIAGINYGMVSYKVNQTYSEVQDIVQGIQDLYSWSHGYYPANSGTFMAAACDNDIFSGVCDCTTLHENCRAAQGPFGDITLEASGRNFVVKVQVSDEQNRTRIASMDWDVVNISCDCNTTQGWCLFSPK